MNMPVKVEYFKNPKNRDLTPAELEAFAKELDQIKQEVLDDLGEKDAKYIRRVYAAIRYSSFLGRACLFAGWFPPAWILGTGLLGFSKIMENMELGHNVMHGQYDWMNDPKFNGQTYEWDTVGTSDNWRQTHNYKHHTYTNIKGIDDDIGYGLLRLFPEQRWKPGFLLQPIYSIPFCLLFQWGVAIQNLEIGRVLYKRKTLVQIRDM
ncbi:acyl-CoA desaturase, partial [Acinetobacter baumannii]